MSAELEQAFDAFDRDAAALGPCLRAARLAQAAGDEARARDAVRRYAEAHGLDDKAAAAVAAFSRQAPVRVYPDRALLAVEGEAADNVFVIVRGDVVVRRDAVGELARLGPGRFFGEAAALFGIRRTATAEARGEVTAMVLPSVALKQLARYVPSVSTWLAMTARDRIVPHLMGPASPLGVLSRAEQLELFRHCRPFSVPRGTALQSIGQVVERVGLIIAGRCDAWRTRLGGQKELMPDLGPGDPIGLLDRLAGEHAHVSVTATTTVTGFSVRFAYLEPLLERHPAIEARLQARLPTPERAHHPDHALPISDSMAEGGPTMSTGERAAFIIDRAGNACRACGFPDADIVCPACGAPA